MSAGPTGLPGGTVAVTTLLRALGAAGPIERLPVVGGLAALRGEIARLLAERHETNERPHDAVVDGRAELPVLPWVQLLDKDAKRQLLDDVAGAAITLGDHDTVLARWRLAAFEARLRVGLKRLVEGLPYDEQPIPPVVAARAARSAGRLREFVARSRAGRAGDSRG